MSSIPFGTSLLLCFLILLASIAQSLEFKGACPNCRKRATPKEIRDMMYVVQVTATDDANRIQFLESLKQADQENYLKLIAENEQMYKDVKIKTNKIAEYKEDIEHKENLLASQGEMIRALSSLKNEWVIEKRSLVMQKEAVELENEKIIKNNRELEKRVNTLEREVKDYDRLKKIVDSAHDNEDEYLKSLRERSSAQEQAKTFYEFLRIKKAELKKAKEESLRLNAELGRYKEKIHFLENAAKQKPPMEKRKDPNEFPRRATLENKIIHETTMSKPQKSSTSRFDPDAPTFLVKGSFQPELDFALLQKDLSNTSVKERTAQLQELVKKPVEMVRPMRSLIYPPGMTKTSVEEMSGMNRSQSAMEGEASSKMSFRSSLSDLNRSKQSDFSNTKKVKLNDMDLGLQANVQKKILSFVNPNN